MAAQNTTRTDGPEQPINESQLSYKTLTVDSSWTEILEVINQVQRELNHLKTDEAINIG